MPLLWSNVVDNVNEAADNALEWSNETISRGNDWVNDSGIADMTLRDVWNVPFDLVRRNRSTPSVVEYNQCKAKNGQSGWDEAGVWRCLFPNANKPPTWFANYNDFLEARNKQYEKRTGPLFKSQKPKLISLEEAKDKPVTGHSVNIETRVAEDGESITRKRIITYYDDNTATEEERESSSRF